MFQTMLIENILNFLFSLHQNSTVAMVWIFKYNVSDELILFCEYFSFNNINPVLFNVGIIFELILQNKKLRRVVYAFANLFDIWMWLPCCWGWGHGQGFPPWSASSPSTLDQRKIYLSNWASCSWKGRLHHYYNQCLIYWCKTSRPELSLF